MNKTVCELFSGVGGFRCGLNHLKSIKDTKKKEKWETVWFSQWEPADKKTQWAHDCYVNRFGTCHDNDGIDTTNTDINAVDKNTIPDHNLLVGGFRVRITLLHLRWQHQKGLRERKAFFGGI